MDRPQSKEPRSKRQTLKNKKCFGLTKDDLTWITDPNGIYCQLIQIIGKHFNLPFLIINPTRFSGCRDNVRQKVSFTFSDGVFCLEMLLHQKYLVKCWKKFRLASFEVLLYTELATLTFQHFQAILEWLELKLEPYFNSSNPIKVVIKAQDCVHIFQPKGPFIQLLRILGEHFGLESLIKTPFNIKKNKRLLGEAWVEFGSYVIYSICLGIQNKIFFKQIQRNFQKLYDFLDPSIEMALRCREQLALLIQFLINLKD